MQVWVHCKQEEPKAHVNGVGVEEPRQARQLGRARPQELCPQQQDRVREAVGLVGPQAG